MITVHSGWASDFSSLGLCSLTPTECTVEEQAGGLFQLKMTHPMDKGGKWWHLTKWNIIKAPAPIRETPLLNMNAAEESVKRQIYSVDVNSRLRLRTKPSTSTGKIISSYRDGTKVIKIGESGSWYQVIIQNGGETGWMHSDYLKYVGEETQAPADSDKPSKVVQPRQTRDQLFRIMAVDRDDANAVVYITALHVFYDLSGVTISGSYAPEDLPAAQAVRDIFANAIKPHGFEAYTDAEGTVTAEYTGRSIVSALTETDGIVQAANARLIRDNFDVFVLKDEARDKGVEIRHGKNLLGAALTEDVSDVITTVIPVGRNKDGEPLYLSGIRYIDAENAAELPVVRAKEISYDVKSGSDEFPDDAAARAELERRARLEFTQNGINRGAVGLDVDFVQLENTRQYARYAALQTVHLYDTVRVISARSGIDARARVTGYVYNCLMRRYDSMVLGELTALKTTLSGYDIAQGTVSGNRLVAGSIDGDIALRNWTVGYAKIALAAIEQLNADSINALIARFGEITAGNITTDALYAALAEIILLRVKQITAETITTDELYAALADMILLRAQQITAGNIETDKLAAQYAEIITLLVRNIKAENIEADRLGAALADFVTMHAGTGEFDFATIQNLVAKALSLQQGSMDTVYIKNLAVTQANILSATLGKLVVKGDDGKYYRVFVGADGTISTEEVGLSVDEVQNGETASGQQIVETSMNVGSLNATNLQANSAVINQILTTALSAEKITAADALIASATIPALYVTAVQAIGGSIDFSANESIRLMVAKKNATFFKTETPTEYVSGDTWIKPDDGTWWIARGMTGKNMPEITTDERFDLLARFGEDAEDYQLMIDDDGYLRVNYGSGEIKEDGYLYSSTGWESLKPSELHTSFIDIAQDKLNIGSGGNVNINAGGELNVNAGAAHFRTAEYSLSILAEDGSEDTIMDFDADGKVLRVSEIEAGNMRPYIAGTTQVTSADVGGIDGLKGMLERAQYEHIIYIQNAHDMSDEAVVIDCCDSLQVDITADTLTRVPPIVFRRVTGNFLLRDLAWIASGQTALRMDSGYYVFENCSAEAATGLHASRNARVVWLGTDENMETAGACETAVLATEGADVRLFGMIPAGLLTESLAGTIKAVGTRVGGNATGETGKTITVDAEYGYYGTENGWNADMLYQGYTEGKGRIYGCMKLELPGDVHVITAATLTLTRDSSAGRGSAANVRIYGSATKYGDRPTLGDLYAERDNAANPGASASFDVTAGAQALLNGDIKQLVLYTGESTTATGKVYSRQYARFTKATLKITY